MILKENEKFRIEGSFSDENVPTYKFSRIDYEGVNASMNGSEYYACVIYLLALPTRAILVNYNDDNDWDTDMLNLDEFEPEYEVGTNEHLLEVYTKFIKEIII